MSPHRGPAPAQQFQSKPFVSQYDQVQAFVLAQDTATEQRAFYRQFSEVEGLLDANEKLMDTFTMAADDETLFSDGSESSTACSCCGPRDRRWSGTSAGSDIFDEDGSVQTRVVESWLEGKKNNSRSDAKVTRRGVDCRIDMGDRVCEWVIWL